MKLSILMPVYNEEERIADALKQALAVDYPCEIELVVVDDGSRDGTSEVLGRMDDTRLRVITHQRNAGKGAAIKTAVDNAEGEYMVILDADLEYDPQDIPRLLEPVLDGRATVVYGNRTFGSHSSYSFWYVMGNKGVTMATNVIYNCWISDVMTCHKAMSTELFQSLKLRERGFAIEPEIAARVLRSGERIYEVPITYKARSREEGKKLTALDGLRVLRTLVRCRVD